MFPLLPCKIFAVSECWGNSAPHILSWFTWFHHSSFITELIKNIQSSLRSKCAENPSCVLMSFIIVRVQLSDVETEKQVQETKTERKEVLWNIIQVCMSSWCLLTYYKATFGANHVSCSVVLHQYGIGVVGTLNSGKSWTISAMEGKQVI